MNNIHPSLRVKAALWEQLGISAKILDGGEEIRIALPMIRSRLLSRIQHISRAFPYTMSVGVGEREEFEGRTPFVVIVLSMRQ